MEDPLKFGFYVLLLLPGFIWVQTRDYHLLREKRSQFEKMLDILLWSAAIWIIACVVPVWWPAYWWPSGVRAETLSKVGAIMRDFSKSSELNWYQVSTVASAEFFLIVCFLSYAAANLWGMARKSPYVDGGIRWVSGRDWYPSVAQKFFDQNLNKAVIISTTETRYIGVLHSAPDSKEDHFIILSEVACLPKLGEGEKEGKPVPLSSIRWLLIRFDDINEVQALTEEAVQRA